MISHTGIGIYSQSILNEKTITDRFDTVFLGGDPVQLETFERETRFKIVPDDTPIYSFREQSFRLPSKRLQNMEPAIAHFPHYNIHPQVKLSFVVTIHDLIQFQYGYGTGLQRTIAKRLLKRAAQNASKVICVSETTRNYLIDFLPGIDNEKIVVIPNRIYTSGSPSMGTSKPIEDPYIVCVGNWKQHKNAALVLQAMTKLHRKFPKLKLCLIGDFGKADKKLKSLMDTGLMDKWLIPIQNISREKLETIYSFAQATVLASLEEGFGYPPLESLKYETLPIVSDIAVMREWFQDEGIYFDPLRLDSLVETLQQWLPSPERSEEKVKAMMPVLDRLSANNFSQALNHLYHEVIP